jgi:hypothetical protein
MVVTWIVDFIWLIYWGPFWDSEEMKDWEKGVHSWTIFWSSIGFIFKVKFPPNQLVSSNDLPMFPREIHSIEQPTQGPFQFYSQ